VAQTEEGFSEEKILGWLTRIIELNTVFSIYFCTRQLTFLIWQIQGKSLNVITLEERDSDNINCLITIR
jgi:hypothetical protein